MEFNKAREGERMNLQTHRLLLTWFVFIRIKTVACAYFTNVDSKMEYNILHQGALKDSFFPEKYFRGLIHLSSYFMLSPPVTKKEIIVLSVQLLKAIWEFNERDGRASDERNCPVVLWRKAGVKRKY